MTQPNFSSIFVKLHDDPAFRNEFAHSPADALRKEGYDPSLFALPSKIDPAQLEQRLDAIFSGKAAIPASSTKALAKLSPDELWSDYSLIGLNPADASLAASDDPGVAVVVVVYGAAIAVGTPVVILGNSDIATIGSIEQLKQLRALSRLTKEQLTFTVHGPSGEAVGNVNADTMHAFLDRVR